MLAKLHVNKIIQIYEVNLYFSCFKIFLNVGLVIISLTKHVGKNFFILFYAKITFMK